MRYLRSNHLQITIQAPGTIDTQVHGSRATPCGQNEYVRENEILFSTGIILK